MRYNKLGYTLCSDYSNVRRNVQAEEVNYVKWPGCMTVFNAFRSSSDAFTNIYRANKGYPQLYNTNTTTLWCNSQNADGYILLPVAKQLELNQFH
jgi:hypothetical protein